MEFSDLFFEFFQDHKTHLIIETELLQVVGSCNIRFYNEGQFSINLDYNETCNFSLDYSEIITYKFIETCIGLNIEIETKKGKILFR